MPMNDIGSEEYRPFVRDSEEPDSSWTDTDVSEHPKFYNVAIKNDNLTNIGSFFDKDNQYNDTTSCNTLALPSDKCYLDKDGGKFCLDNTRLQLRPPALITDPQNNYAINEVGIYKDYASIPDDPNRVINGGNDTEEGQSLGYNVPSSIGNPIGRINRYVILYKSIAAPLIVEKKTATDSNRTLWIRSPTRYPIAPHGLKRC